MSSYNWIFILAFLQITIFWQPGIQSILQPFSQGDGKSHGFDPGDWSRVATGAAGSPAWHPRGFVPVFTAGEGGFPCIRIPAISRCGNPAILHAFAECRMRIGDGCIPYRNHSKSNPDQVTTLCYKNSTDDGATWGPLTLLSAFGNNPTVVCDRRTNNTILQFNILFQSDTPGRERFGIPGSNVQMVSVDNGAHWGEPTLVDLGVYSNVNPGPGTGIQFSESSPTPGRIAFIGYYGDYEYAIVWFSDDGGRTYKTAQKVLPLMDESVLVELSNGSLMANMRNNHLHNCDCRAVSISRDGGRTFSNITFDAALISPVCQGTMLRTYNGSIIFANPASKTSRTTGLVRRSDDDGKTWPYSFPVTDNRTGFAYSSLTEVNNRQEVGLLWETQSDGCIGPSCRIVFSKIKVL